MSIPPHVFGKIQEKWANAVKDLDCKTDETFCITNQKCEEATKILEPVGLQMSGYIFSM